MSSHCDGKVIENYIPFYGYSDYVIMCIQVIDVLLKCAVSIFKELLKTVML